MAKFTATLKWQRTTPEFKYETYNRNHTISFAGGVSYTASAAPEYKGDPRYVNPEECLLAALSSCHMLTFLAIAAKKKLSVEEYLDQPTAELGKNAAGKLSVTNVHLRPRIKFSGATPSPEELSAMHHESHEKCFIASSFNGDVIID